MPFRIFDLMAFSGIKFFYDNVKVSLKNRTALKRHIAKLIKTEGGTLRSLTYIFCSDRQLLKINQDYLNHNDLTDIITFNLSEDPAMIEGEIYISIDRVRENARKFQVPLSAEIHRVMFHGALHLCGYRDKSVRDQKEMRAAEDRWLGRL